MDSHHTSLSADPGLPTPPGIPVHVCVCWWGVRVGELVSRDCWDMPLAVRKTPASCPLPPAPCPLLCLHLPFRPLNLSAACSAPLLGLCELDQPVLVPRPSSFRGQWEGRPQHLHSEEETKAGQPRTRGHGTQSGPACVWACQLYE